MKLQDLDVPDKNDDGQEKTNHSKNDLVIERIVDSRDIHNMVGHIRDIIGGIGHIGVIGGVAVGLTPFKIVKCRSRGYGVLCYFQ